MTDHRQPDPFTRRAFVLEKILLPLGLGLVGAYGALRLNQRYKEGRDVSISIIRSDSAVEPKAESPLFDPFAMSPPKPTPDPNPRYTYTSLVRNNGDFPEEQVTIAIAYESEDDPASLLSGPELDASSSLLAQTIQPVEPIHSPPSYAMSLPRMNPGEWVSFKTSWTQKVRVNVEFRSDTTFDSTD